MCHHILPLPLPSVLLDLPSCHTVHLNKSHLPHPTSLLLQPLLFAFQLPLVSRLVPRSPSFLSILSGRSLPGVIHLSLLTWPPTGLLGRQVLRGEDNGCWGPRGKQQTLFSVMVTYLRTAKTLGNLFCNREPRQIQTGSSWLWYCQV